MRSFAILLASLLAFGGLAGCVGGDKESAQTQPTGSGDDVTPNSVPPTNTPQLKVLAPLTSSLTMDGPMWVAAGTEVPVSVAAPANAKGAVSYAWAIGPLAGTKEVTAAPADTGSKGSDYIKAGSAKSLTYATAGIYQMHCHPHPFMSHNVTVIDGYAGPKAVDVFITDGASENEYRFVPENIVVGVGTVVNYKNVGAQPHTATATGAQSPPLKALPLKADKGNIKIEGDGWLNVVAIVQDSEGRLGVMNKSIYVTEELPSFATKTVEMAFTYGTPAPLAGTPAEAAPKTEAVSLELGGLVTISYAFADAAGGAGAPENLAQVEIHFTKDGETQDSLTGGPDPEGVLEGKVVAGAYTLKVVPLQGAEITGTITIDVVYDLVPPMPAMAAPPSDGHGGHHH